MAGWLEIGSQSQDRTTGGRQMPPYNGFCAKCLRRRPVAEMQVETNERSAAFGYMVCRGKYQEGGCFDGPYPAEADNPKPRPDDLSPVRNLLHT